MEDIVEAFFHTLQKKMPNMDMHLERWREHGTEYEIYIRVENTDNQGATKAPDVLEKPTYVSYTMAEDTEEGVYTCTQTLVADFEDIIVRLHFHCRGTQIIYAVTRTR